jgi:hypothetical protein
MVAGRLPERQFICVEWSKLGVERSFWESEWREGFAGRTERRVKTRTLENRKGCGTLKTKTNCAGLSGFLVSSPPA